MARYVGANRRQGVYNEEWSPADYPLNASYYFYNVRDVFVEATLVETYLAASKVKSEVFYVFEVPPEASVCKFTAQVGNVVVEAFVDEKEAANSKYNEAKQAGVKTMKLDKVSDECKQCHPIFCLISLRNRS